LVLVSEAEVSIRIAPMTASPLVMGTATVAPP